MFEQLGLIGCGLMGGSFALALKKAGLVQRVVGYSKSPSTTERARQLGVIDVEAPSALLAAAGADIVLLAVPVAATEDTLKAIRHLVTPQVLVMDVGSTKTDVVHAARQALRERVGSFASPPGHRPRGLGRRIRRCRALPRPPGHPDAHRAHPDRPAAEGRGRWGALGCRVQSMSPEAHDSAFAAISHLPHMLAFAMMNGITAQAEGEAFLSVAAPASGTSPASPPATPRCGATFCWPTATSCWRSRPTSARHSPTSSTPCAKATARPSRTSSPWPAKPAPTGALGAQRSPHKAAS